MPNRVLTFFVQFTGHFYTQPMKKGIHIPAIYNISNYYACVQTDTHPCQHDILFNFCQVSTQKPGTSKDATGFVNIIYEDNSIRQEYQNELPANKLDTTGQLFRRITNCLREVRNLTWVLNMINLLFDG